MPSHPARYYLCILVSDNAGFGVCGLVWWKRKKVGNVTGVITTNLSNNFLQLPVRHHPIKLCVSYAPHASFPRYFILVGGDETELKKCVDSFRS